MSDEQFRPEDAAPPPPRPDSQGHGTTPPPQPAYPYTDLPPDVIEQNPDARMWGMFCHLAGLFGYIFPVVGNIVGPLVFWQLKKDDPFVDDQGKEALNFQISMTIYAFVSVILMFLCIGIFLLIAVGIVNLVFLLIAAVKANDGQRYRYPIAIRFIK
jgi:uncharacterized Tic20 family protein